MQRYLLGQTCDARELGFAFSYGLVELELAAGELEKKLIRIKQLRAVMPSGVVIECPGNADIPALHINDRFDRDSKPFVVCLAVPLWHETRANASEGNGQADGGGRPIYSVASVSFRDENTGVNPQAIPTRRLNARLMLDDGDKTGLEVLPLLRVVHDTRGDKDIPAEDTNFIPPCLVIGGSRSLHDGIATIANLVASERSQLVRQLEQVGFSVKAVREDQVERLMRLMVLNRHAASLGHMAKLERTTPSQAYVALRMLHAELAALVPPAEDPFDDIPDYEHEQLELAFGELFKKLPPMIPGQEETGWVGRAFALRDQVWTVELSEDEVTTPIDYLLSVRSGEDPDRIRKVVEDGTKFLLDSFPQLRLRVKVRGVKLKEERAPSGLPAPNDVHYFRLCRADGPMSVMAWGRIKRDKNVAVRWEELPAEAFADMKLHWKVPQGAATK
jgi:type VI secretion system protein ImpJ